MIIITIDFYRSARTGTSLARGQTNISGAKPTRYAGQGVDFHISENTPFDSLIWLSMGFLVIC